MDNLLATASKEDPEELFELLDVVGHGAFGTVCSCLNKNTMEMVAVKFIPIDPTSSDTRKLQREIDIMKMIPHAPEVVTYHGCYVKDDMLLIVMEYCDGGSVMDILRLPHKLTEEQVAAACAAVVKGLHHLHKNVKIMHRDVKAANVLINSKGEGKLADFGVSAQLNTTAQRQKTVIGSPFWMAPEVIDQADAENATGYDSKSDIWSLGITALEMAEGKPPHYELQPIKAILKIPNEPPPTLKEPQKWSEEFTHFLAKCLQKDPAHRLSAAELLEDPFIQKGMKYKHVLAELVEECLPALVKARAEKQNDSDAEEGDSYEDEDSSDDDSEHSHTWFSLEKGSMLTCNSSTMKAAITDAKKSS